jgi:hypothetical protein
VHTPWLASIVRYDAYLTLGISSQESRVDGSLKRYAHCFGERISQESGIVSIASKVMVPGDGIEELPR